MTLSVYLSSEIHDVLSCFGTLDEVVDKILVAGSQGIIDIMQKPPAPEKKGGRYYNVNIKNEEYFSLVETYGTKSSKISIRRLLYWFVENEVYNDLGWVYATPYMDSKLEFKYQVLTELQKALFKAKTYIPEYQTEIDNFRKLILQIEENLWHAK